MSFFWKRDPSPTACEKILSILYRISEEELNEHLQAFHRVEIVSLSHRFLKAPNKIGVEGELLLFATQHHPPTTSWRRVKRHGNIEISQAEGSARFLYESDTQLLAAQFEGPPSEIRLFALHLSHHVEKYAAVYLYIANRFRADRALHREFKADRQFFDDLSRVLRESTKLEAALELIRERIGATALELFLCSPCNLPDTLLSIATSSIASGEEADVRVSVIVGQHDGISGSQARGKLVVHGSTENLESEELKSFLNRVSRELAARIDELDEAFETTLITQSTQLAELFCSQNFSTKDAVIEPFLKVLGDTMTGILRRELLPAHDVTSPLKLKVQSSRGPMFRSLFGSLRNLKSSLLNGPDIEVISANGETPELIISNRRKSRDALSFSGDAILLGAIRRHVFEWIQDLVSLLLHFLQLEWKRKSWMQRTMHEMKHPLQGIVAIGELLQVMMTKSTVRRSDLQHYLEDLVSSVESTRVLLNRFDAVNGIESLEVSPRTVFIEADVIRPTRRLLQGTAHTKNVILNDTIGYEVVPQLKIDPNLLRLVFFNLLDNAVKYSAVGSAIDIHCSSSEAAFHVDITDSGIPVLAKDEKRLFLEEFRGENTKSISGLGLGLHTAKSLASKLGCEISLADHGRESGQVTFRVSIPASLRSLEEV